MAPNDRAQFIDDRAAQVAISRAEPGNLDYAFSFDASDAGRVRLIERWTDAESLDAHIAAIQVRGGPPSSVQVTGRDVIVVNGELHNASR